MIVFNNCDVISTTDNAQISIYFLQEMPASASWSDLKVRRIISLGTTERTKMIDLSNNPAWGNFIVVWYSCPGGGCKRVKLQLLECYTENSSKSTTFWTSAGAYLSDSSFNTNCGSSVNAGHCTSANPVVSMTNPNSGIYNIESINIVPAADYTVDPSLTTYLPTTINVRYTDDYSSPATASSTIWTTHTNS